MDANDLVDMNPWWDVGEVPIKLRRESERWIFKTLLGLMETRQIVSLVGLRRCGKSTLMYQLIQHLIGSGVNPRNILYFSFDISVDNLKHLVNTYLETVPGIKDGDIFIFLDEIQKLEDWSNRIKVLYDTNPEYKFVISGSASLEVSQGGSESLAGRILKVKIDPLEFGEYLDIREIDRFIGRKEELEMVHKEYMMHEKRFMQAFKDSIISGGIIETCGMNHEVLKYYMNSSIIDNIVMKDIPKRYPIENPAILKDILKTVSLNPGMLLNFEHLGNAFGLSRQTISRYMEYLEDSFLIKTTYNYSGSFLASTRKLKKAYLVHPTLATAFIDDEISPNLFGKLVENCVVSHVKNEFFFKRDGNEIDMVLRFKDKPVPIEIKYTSDIENRTLRVMRSFMKRYKSPFGVILTRNIFDSRNGILILPIPMFLLMKDPLGTISDHSKVD